MNLDDEDLMLLEQLTYLDSGVLKAAGIPSNKLKMDDSSTIEEILSVFGDEQLENLRNYDGNLSAEISGEEWADIIEALQKNENLKDLRLCASYPDSGTKLGLCFRSDDWPSDQAVVAFKGTSGGDEWADNAEGMNMSDTPCQIAAREFVDSLGYSDITVVGHSKGGNKAMYVAITSDNVTKCVAMDGQGFSEQFMNKYAEQIAAKASNITNYSLSMDFVHILLMQMEGINMVFCSGNGVDGFAENHSPNSFFASYNDDGTVTINSEGIEEARSMTILRGFVQYVMDNAPADDLNQIIDWIAPALKDAFGAGDLSKVPEILLGKVEEDPETAGMVLGYLAEYLEDTGITDKEIAQLLEDFGLTEPLKSLIKKLISTIRENLQDEDKDYIINTLLAAICNLAGVDIDTKVVWSTAAKTASDLKSVSDDGITRDYSEDFENQLLGIISEIQSEHWYDVTKWDVWYRVEDFFGQLKLGDSVDEINSYYRKKMDIEDTDAQTIQTIFQNAREKDAEYAGSLDGITDTVEELNTSLAALIS